MDLVDIVDQVCASKFFVFVHQVHTGFKNLVVNPGWPSQNVVLFKRGRWEVGVVITAGSMATGELGDCGTSANHYCTSWWDFNAGRWISTVCDCGGNNLEAISCARSIRPERSSILPSHHSTAGWNTHPQRRNPWWVRFLFRLSPFIALIQTKYS